MYIKTPMTAKLSDKIVSAFYCNGERDPRLAEAAAFRNMSLSQLEKLAREMRRDMARGKGGFITTPTGGQPRTR